LTAHPGWEIDETFSLVDAGVSGYSGANLGPEAALGGFLNMLRAGKIPLTPTKVLHIDDMSRLSRMKPRDARNRFEEILEMGVEIFDAEDNKLYTKESLDDLLDLIISMLRRDGAHKHSKNLSNKIKAAWIIKKQRLVDGGHKYKFHTHAWLKWNESAQSYDLDPEKANLIKRVFELAGMGIGVRGISKRMNRDGIPPLTNYRPKNGKPAMWSNSVIARLFNGKSVLGYNENLNPPIKMYPAVISEKVYYTAQAKIADRRTHKFYGRSADKAHNIFAGISRCSKCDRSMCFEIHKREWTPLIGSKGGKAEYPYLNCHGIIDGACEKSMMRYDKMEESFAMMLSGSNFVNAYAETRPETGSMVETLKGKIADTQTHLERYGADYVKSPSDLLAGLINKTEIKVKELNRELEQATTINIGTSPMADTRDELLAILYKGWNDVDVRLKLRELIRAVVEKIIVNGPDKSYTIHWKNKDKPTLVEIFRKAYKIDGILIPSRPDWEEEIVRAGEVIKRQEEEKRERPHWPKGTFAKQFVEGLEVKNSSLSLSDKLVIEPVSTAKKLSPKHIKLLEQERKRLNVELLRRVKVPVV
jgi:DNA invertase Pin-like site-specific DNA recombinase